MNPSAKRATVIKVRHIRDSTEELEKVARHLYSQTMEEQGKIIRLLMGLSAGAISVMSAFLNANQSSMLLFLSLFLFAVSFVFGLRIQYLLMSHAEWTLKEVGEGFERDRRNKLNLPYVCTLWSITKERKEKLGLLPQFQVGMFGLASFFLIAHYFSVNIGI